MWESCFRQTPQELEAKAAFLQGEEEEKEEGEEEVAVCSLSMLCLAQNDVLLTLRVSYRSISSEELCVHKGERERGRDGGV